MNTNLKKLFSEKKSLEEKILHLEKKKRQLRTHHISLQQQLKNNKISTSKFHELLNEMLKNRSYEQWMIYFEEYHNYYKSLLKICNQKITKEKNSHKNKKIIITGLAAIFLIFALIFFATNPQFTGLAVDNITPETNTTKNITEIINITEEISTETKIVTPKTKISKEQITTTKSKIIINRPVKWIQKIKLNKSKNETLTLPKSSNNISILTAQEIEESLEELITYNEIVNTSSKEEIRTGILTGQVTTEVDKRKGILTKFWEWATEFTITGQVIQETDLEEIITETPQEKIIDLTKIKETEIAIEFYTEAPTSKETKTERGKKIQISAADELAYEEILTYTELDIKVPNDSIYLYHLANNTQTKVDFESFDLDSDGFIDYIEWTVPHLSTQTYEIIIITKAEHLDNNREFIKNIYEEAKELDDIWTPEINDGEYARVTFERDLDSTKDITIFPRITSGNPQIEIYELNQNELIAKFENINSNEYNKVLLTKLQGIQDVFDLKIIGGSIEFDHIIDPVTNLIATSCDLNDAANTACFDAISTDGSTNFAFTKNAHIDVPLQTLSNVETVNSATLYYDSSGMLSGTWSVYIKDSRDGTTLCSSDPAQEYETETRDSIDCSGITPTQLLNGVWLQIDNDDGAGPQDVTIDYAYLYVDYEEPTVNLAPTNPTPSINSTDGTNFTTQDLNCFSTISDPNSDNLNVTVQWYNNSNLFLTQNFNNNYPSETAFVAILDAGNTSENDIWKCGITLSDGLLNSSQINSSELTIESSPGFSNLTVTSCDINNVANTPCFDAISTDEGTSFALGKGIHIDAPFQTLSDIPTINSATLYYDSSGTLSGTWNIYVRDSRDGTIICSVVSAPEDVTETRNSLDCSEITPTQLSNGIWLQIDNDDTAGPEDMTIDYVYLHVDYSEQNTPTISHIDTISPQSITEAGETPITFSFQVTDLDGTTDINDSTAYAKFQKTGETTRETLCTKTGNINETIANFSCTIDMWYFDGAGDWTINTSISDTTNRYAENSSTSFLLGQTTAMTFSPSSISFSGISSPADTNVLADQSILINNTGNDEISTGNVRVTATNLVGETVSSFAIYAENFTVHTAAACGVGTPMQNATEIGIVGATLTIGNFSLNDGSTGQEQLFYCLEVMNADLTAQTYSTTASGAWTITLLLAALRITKPKKKKKQSLYLEKPELLKNPEFLEFLESERIFEQFETKLTKENEIPATIFKSRNALEAICRYLKDEKDMKLSEIASALNRDPRTIWTSYHNADAEIFPPEVTDIKVPVSIFEKENLSILESISLYLKNNGMKNKEIAELLGKNSKTIWTFIDRAKKKSEKQNKLLEESQENSQDVSVSNDDKLRLLLKNPEFLEFLESERIFEQFETKLTKENEIPATIFKSRNALEAICRYLKDEKDMKLSEIASALNRDPRTIWTSYHNADAEIFPPEVTDIKVPVSIFEKENLSILESISLYLKNNGMKNKEIAELLGKNSKTIWTFIDRAKKKSE